MPGWCDKEAALAQAVLQETVKVSVRKVLIEQLIQSVEQFGAAG